MTLREPLEQWKNLNNSNLLQLLYENPEMWAFPFQIFAMLTMIENHTKLISNNIEIMERSIFSAKYCFLEAQNQIKNIDNVKCEILKRWHYFIETQIQIEINLTIYIRTTANISFDRIKSRNRPEESSIQLSYLNLLEGLHDNWLIENQHQYSVPVIILNGNRSPLDIQKELDQKLKEFISSKPT